MDRWIPDRPSRIERDAFPVAGFLSDQGFKRVEVRPDGTVAIILTVPEASALVTELTIRRSVPLPSTEEVVWQMYTNSTTEPAP